MKNDSKLTVVIISYNHSNTTERDQIEVFESEMNADAFVRGWAEEKLDKNDFEEIDWMDDGWINDLNYALRYYGCSVQYYVNINFNPKFK